MLVNCRKITKYAILCEEDIRGDFYTENAFIKIVCKDQFNRTGGVIRTCWHQSSSGMDDKRYLHIHIIIILHHFRSDFNTWKCLQSKTGKKNIDRVLIIGIIKCMLTVHTMSCRAS